MRPADRHGRASSRSCRASWAAITPATTASRRRSPTALAEQYLPRFAGDALPVDRRRPRARGRRQARHAGRHLRDWPEADRHQGPVWTAPRRARRAADPDRDRHRARPARTDPRRPSTRWRPTSPALGGKPPAESLAEEIYDYMMERLRAWYVEAGRGVTHRDVRRRARHPARFAARFRRPPARARGIPRAARCRGPHGREQAHRQHPEEGRRAAEPARRSGPARRRRGAPARGRGRGAAPGRRARS